MTDTEIVENLMRVLDMCKELNTTGSITIGDDIYLITYHGKKK